MVALRAMSHRQAVVVMVLVTLLWSMAGVVTRQVEQAQGLTLTFWRSTFNAMALAFILCVWRKPSGVWKALLTGGSALWGSGLCWATMFTAFMWALTMTTVANVLVAMALGPLVTVVLARLVLGQRLAWPSIMAVILAGLGLLLMQAPALMAQWAPSVPDPATGVALDEAARSAATGDPSKHGLGVLVALAVPLAGALNWVLIRAASDRARSAAQRSPDFLLSVLIGATVSALASSLVSNPMHASGKDLAWLALLGVFQLAIPCLLAVMAARVLQPSEVSLLSLLEVVFGVAWAWIGTAEQPEQAVVIGGFIVLATLALHEFWNARQHRQSGR